jgi:hypothetical protein
MAEAVQKKGFSWLRIVAESGMHGLSAILATHTRPVSFDEESRLLALQIENRVKALAEGGALNSMVQFLRGVFGERLEVRVEYLDDVVTPARIAKTRATQRMTVALADLMEDTHGEMAASIFGGKIVRESISYRDYEPGAAN